MKVMLFGLLAFALAVPIISCGRGDECSAVKNAVSAYTNHCKDKTDVCCTCKCFNNERKKILPGSATCTCGERFVFDCQEYTEICQVDLSTGTCYDYILYKVDFACNSSPL